MKGFQWSSCLGFAKDDTLHLLVESNLLTPTTARVYVNFPEGILRYINYVIGVFPNGADHFFFFGGEDVLKEIHGVF